MGTAQSAEHGGRASQEVPTPPAAETMMDAPAIGLDINGADSGGSDASGRLTSGISVAPQIDVAMPMDISGTPRSSEFRQPLDYSMPDSSFASSFGSFMSPPDGAPVLSKPVAQPVVMTWRHCQAESVFLAGDFNDWQLNTEMQVRDCQHGVHLRSLCVLKLRRSNRLLCMCVAVFQPFEGEYVVILNLVPAKYHYKVRQSSCGVGPACRTVLTES